MGGFFFCFKALRFITAPQQHLNGSPATSPPPIAHPSGKTCIPAVASFFQVPPPSGGAIERRARESPCGAVETNLTSIPEDAGSIPGPAHLAGGREGCEGGQARSGSLACNFSPAPLPGLKANLQGRGSLHPLPKALQSRSKGQTPRQPGPGQLLQESW